MAYNYSLLRSKLYEYYLLRKMNICTGTTAWSHFFSLCEIVLTSGLLFFYLKAIWNLIVHNEKDFYEKLDLLVIFLSSSQIVLFLIMFLFNEYFIISFIISILKLNENAIICCLLLVIIMWKYYTVTFVIVNYFMMFILVFDILCFLFGIFTYKPFNTDYCKPKVVILLVLLGFILDIGAIVSGIYLKSSETEETAELTTEGDQLFINNMFNKYVDSMKRMMKSYLIITLLFLSSFTIDLLFQIIFKNNHIPIKTEQELPKLDTISSVPVCNYYGSFGNEYSMKQFFICFLSFCLRDIIPHLAIYFSILIYKPSNLSRSSSFIEIL